MTEDHIPIIEITDENFEVMWPAINNAMKEASFIALDCELSGLGNRSKLNCKEIDLRYQNTKNIAQEYSIVSLGISCFSCQSWSTLDLHSEGKNHLLRSHNYVVQTFNVLTLCSTKYVVECDSIKFLLSHGFDFNRQYSHGLPYIRGEEKQSTANKENSRTVRNIFHLIVKYCKPIVLHNGFVDLVFLYQSFYADLPKNVETFAADLLEMFPAGIYDTKYVSEFHQSFSATFLEYVFKKLQLENEAKKKTGAWHCRVKFPPYPKQGIKGLGWHNYLQVFDEVSCESETECQPLCQSYKYHGWCSRADSCKMSHNIDRIVRELHRPTRRKRKSYNGVASSVAQLINIKKQKMERLDKNEEKSQNSTADGDLLKKNEIVVMESSSEVTTRGTNGSSGNVNSACGSTTGNLNVDTRVTSSSSSSANDNSLGPKHVGSVSSSASVNLNDSFATPKAIIDLSGDSPSLKTSDWSENEITVLDDDENSIEEVFSASDGGGLRKTVRVNRNGNSDSIANIGSTAIIDSNSFSCTDKEIMEETTTTELTDAFLQATTKTDDRAGKNRDCNGHSAGYDAFMTGFIFAYDVASLGRLPTISAFQNAKDMNLHHVVGKVYLIGKGFPFLVRNSAYRGTSPTHDRIIKLIRSG